MKIPKIAARGWTCIGCAGCITCALSPTAISHVSAVNMLD